MLLLIRSTDKNKQFCHLFRNGCELFVGLWFKALDQDHGMDMLWLWWGKDFSWLLVEMMVSYFSSLASYFIALTFFCILEKMNEKKMK